MASFRDTKSEGLEMWGLDDFNATPKKERWVK